MSLYVQNGNCGQHSLATSLDHFWEERANHMINSPLKLEPPSQTFIDMTLNTYSHSPVPFMFHNSSDTLRIIPPLDMPTPPRLRMPRGAPGPHQDYQLLTYVMTWDDIAAWVDRYKLLLKSL